jgi:hypothetical protein
VTNHVYSKEYRLYVKEFLHVIVIIGDTSMSLLTKQYSDWESRQGDYFLGILRHHNGKDNCVHAQTVPSKKMPAILIQTLLNLPHGP